MSIIYIFKIGSVLSFILLFFLIWDWQEKKQRNLRFINRIDLSQDEIYRNYFTDSIIDKEIVLMLWNEVADSLRVPPGKLRPTDRFDIELGPIKGWEFDGDHVELYLNMQRRLKKLRMEQKDINITDIKTLSDYINTFGVLVK